MGYKREKQANGCVIGQSDEKYGNVNIYANLRKNMKKMGGFEGKVRENACFYSILRSAYCV